MIIFLILCSVVLSLIIDFVQRRVESERQKKFDAQFREEALQSLIRTESRSPLAQAGSKTSQSAYWENHDTLYAGGSSKSREWGELKRRTKDRDGWCCINCGSRELLQVDHITPLSKGGRNTMSNLQTLCKKCHETKTGRPLRDWRENSAGSRTRSFFGSRKWRP